MDVANWFFFIRGCSHIMSAAGGGVQEMMKIADEGGGEVNKHPNLADIICEQPLICSHGLKVNCE